MPLILIDAMVLIGLLKAFTDENLDFWSAVIMAVVAAIGTNVLANVLIMGLGVLGLIPAVAIVAVILGVVVSFLYGAEIKRACLIGGIFAVVHIVLAIGISILFQR